MGAHSCCPVTISQRYPWSSRNQARSRVELRVENKGEPKRGTLMNEPAICSPRLFKGVEGVRGAESVKVKVSEQEQKVSEHVSRRQSECVQWALCSASRQHWNLRDPIIPKLRHRIHTSVPQLGFVGRYTFGMLPSGFPRVSKLNHK